MVKLRQIKFTSFETLASIVGYGALLIRSAFGVITQQWADSLLFLILGLALVVGGGYRLIFGYFKNGLTPSEVNKIVAVVVGFVSIFVGILTTPWLDIDYPVFKGIKVIICAVAILIITLDVVNDELLSGGKK